MEGEDKDSKKEEDSKEEAMKSFEERIREQEKFDQEIIFSDEEEDEGLDEIHMKLESTV